MYFYTKKDLPSKEVLPGIVLRSVYLPNTMITFFDLAAGSRIPAHKHPHEQISYMLHGTITMTVGGETRTMQPGDIAVIPANVEHSVVVGEQQAVALDAWHPIRQDYVLDK